MEYNTQKKKLLLPEYGRNIQKMVDYLLTIEDREERTRAAKTVIDVMGNLYPHLRDVPDFRHKLWDHLAIMSEFKLDIDTPYPLPSLSKLQEKPERLPYSSNHIKYKQISRKTHRQNQRAGRSGTKKSTDRSDRQPHEEIIPHLE